MKFSIGDKVILKRTGEEGTITGIIGKDMMEVEVNGTAFPVYSDEIDHPYLKWFTEKNKAKKKTSLPEQLPVEKEKLRPVRLPKGIYLSFMPVFKSEDLEDVVELLKVYLLNETPAAIRFHYDVRFYNHSDFFLEGSLHAFGNIYLHSIPYADMTDQPRFHWGLSDAVNDNNKPEEGIIRIKPEKLFKQINELLVKNEPTFSYLLVEDFVLKPKEEKKQPAERFEIPEAAKPGKISSFADLPRNEIDLHIEELIDDWKGLSNSEIMDIQLRTLEKYVHLAIVHKLERVAIIHGLGTGALREAVHRFLKDIPEVKSFRNEWMAKYGFGATEVIFKY
jgi:hypothetical protein